MSPAEVRPPPARGASAPIRARLVAYGSGALVVAASASTAWFVFGHSQLADVAMVLLLGVVVVSMRFGYGPSLVAALSSALVFEYFFLPPYFSFAVADLRYTVTFAVMLFVAFLVSHLTRTIRDQADTARDRERRTASLYELSRALGMANGREAIVQTAIAWIRGVFGAKAAVLLVSPDDRLEPVAGEEVLAACGIATDLAGEAWRASSEAGPTSANLDHARCLFVPLDGSRGGVGVIALPRADALRIRDADDRRLLEAAAGLIGSAVERANLADEARQTRRRVETERTRNALLSSVSHDLRTPLGVITGATSALLEPDGPQDESSRRRLLETAHEEALRLNRLVGNLLEMTRLEAGTLRVRKEPQALEEVVGAALTRLEDRLRGRAVGTALSSDLPLVPFDPVLIEQVLVNLVENATKYTPRGSPIDVVVHRRAGSVETEVADRGPGIAPADLERVFEKFYRARDGEGGGVGLGLTICRGIVTLHGGKIWAEERSGGGASFRFTLPLDHRATSAPAGAEPAAATAERTWP